MKKIIYKSVVIFYVSVFSFNAFGQMIVEDPSAIFQIASVLSQAIQQVEQLEKITQDIENWRNLDWANYKEDLGSLLSAMQDMQGISYDINTDVADFKKYFPGYDTKILDFNKSFSDRNSALMNILQQQIHVADQAYKINHESAEKHPNTAAAIALETLSSVRELNVLLASETKAESAYRANHLQEKAESKQAIENLIGTHKTQDSYQTQVGEGQ